MWRVCGHDRLERGRRPHHFIGSRHEYKFTLDGWTAQEEFTDGDPCTSTIDGYVNRTVDITAAATLSVVCYNSCDACDGSGGGDNGGGTDPTTTTFNVDMSCATEAGATLNGATEITEVFVTGPWCGWCAADGYNVLTDADGDGIFSVEIADLTGDVEYKYGINGFDDQEQLVDDMVDGGTCAPITDFSGYANRQITAGSTADDVFGSCSACDDNGGGDNGGGTDPTSTTFNVDMRLRHSSWRHDQWHHGNHRSVCDGSLVWLVFGGRLQRVD